jgi:hypothetical protein
LLIEISKMPVVTRIKKISDCQGESGWIRFLLSGEIRKKMFGSAKTEPLAQQI